MYEVTVSGREMPDGGSGKSRLFLVDEVICVILERGKELYFDISYLYIAMAVHYFIVHNVHRCSWKRIRICYGLG